MIAYPLSKSAKALFQKWNASAWKCNTCKSQDVEDIVEKSEHVALGKCNKCLKGIVLLVR